MSLSLRFEHVKIAVGGKLLKEEEHTKILGVSINNDLTWDTHARNVLNNLKFHYRAFSRSCRMLTLDSRLMLYNATIASRLNYCDAVWDSCSVDCSNKLQTLQNRCARRILNQMPGTSAAPLMQQLGWIRLADKRKLHKTVMLHRLLQGAGPEKLLERLQLFKNESSTSTRGAASNNLYITGFRTNYVKRSFFYDAVTTWNKLPSNLKEIKSNKTFKAKLQTHLLNSQHL